MSDKTIAQRISEMPFFQGCREADQICARSKSIDDDTIWRFEDGSQLTSYTDENKLEVLS